MTQALEADRLKDVLDGFPEGAVTQETFDMLARLAIDLDALGRENAETGEPLVDEQTLMALLRVFVDRPSADRLVRLLGELPAPSLRRAGRKGPPVTEVPWFRLARKVVIFDPTPHLNFRELHLNALTTDSIVRAVHSRFPSMEEELLVPDLLPPRIEALLQDMDSLNALLRVLVRQLGWWASFAALLLVPATATTRSIPDSRAVPEMAGSAWPLSMYLLGAAVGGWTLTVLGGCILAPVR